MWLCCPKGFFIMSRGRAQGAAIMAGPNEEDLKAQMASLSAEMTAAVNSVTSSQAPATAVAPAGMTRAEFQEWKAAQTERAKARLLELEERLRRLQENGGCDAGLCLPMMSSLVSMGQTPPSWPLQSPPKNS